jgi:uncharacterized protein (TIGR02145 family)
MTVGRIVKAPALLALFCVIFVAGVRYATVAETQTPAFTDGRDGKTYKTVVIGGKAWMAENLNIVTEGSWCYDNKESNCEKYGRLYNWKAAKTACPAGWRLPSRKEWGDLAKAAGGSGKYGAGGKKAGKKLKSTYGWNNNGNGADNFGFSALPGGSRDTNGDFLNAGYYGHWWTATEGNAGGAYYRFMHYDYDYVNELNNDKGRGFSVRCREESLVTDDW